jgi:undecaprenyl-diphosphatase
LAVSAVTVGLTKAIVGRSRPPVSLHLVPESDHSFPSGHATDGTAVFLAIALVTAMFVLRRPAMRLASVALGAFASVAMGASRLVLGVHWPSDVVAGLALGLGASLAITMTAAVIARLTPPPPEQPSWTRRSAARAVQLLTRQRRGPEQGLLAT